MVSIARLWIVTALGLGALAGMLAPLSTVDLAYAIRLGREIIETAAIPAVDTYTFTAAGRPWVDQQWLFQVVVAAVHASAGWGGLVLLRAVLIAAIVGLVALAAAARGVGWRTAALLAIGALLLASPALALRAQLLGALLFALTLALSSLRLAWGRALWLVPVVTVAWANIHGSFVLAPLVVAWVAFEEWHAGRPMHGPLVVLGLTLLATAVTPFGPSVWAYALSVTAEPAVRRLVTEWQPMSLLTPLGAAFYASVTAAVLVAFRAARAKRVRPATLAWIAALAILGIVAERNILWWSLGGAVALAGLLPAPQAAERATIPRLNATVAALLGLALVAALPWWRSAGWGAERALLADAPIGIATAARTLLSPGARVWVPQHWGSWFEFAAPDLLVAVDSRIELFPAVVWNDHLTLISASPGWADVLDRWQVDAVVVERNGPLAAALSASGGWLCVGSDDQAATFVRTASGGTSSTVPGCARGIARVAAARITNGATRRIHPDAAYRAVSPR